ncbi:MAG: hypothetical protein ABIQ88_02310 [Chitinophagaceae bacterium]
MNSLQMLPQVSETFTPGAIIFDSWGWEQSNYDFYCIITRKENWVTILPMKKNEVFIANFCSKVTPTEIDYSAKPIRKKIKVFRGLESGFTMRPGTSGGWVFLWNGKEKTATHYA